MADSTFATMPLARTSGCAHPLETNFTPPIHVSWIPCVDCPGNHDYCLNLFAMISIACSTLQSYMTQSGKYLFVHAFAAKAPNACFDPTEHCHMHLPSLCTEKKATRSAKRSPRSPHAAYAGGAAASGSSAAGSADSSAAVSSAASSAGSASTGGSASGSAGSAGCSAGVSPVGVPGAGMRAT